MGLDLKKTAYPVQTRSWRRRSTVGTRARCHAYERSLAATSGAGRQNAGVGSLVSSMHADRAEQAMLPLILGFTGHGYEVDLSKGRGAVLAEVPESGRMVASDGANGGEEEE